MSSAPTGLVYRDTAVQQTQQALVEALVAELLGGERMSSLLAASTLETALADVGDPLAREAAEVTDALASAVVHGSGIDSRALATRIARWGGPAELRTSVPEGFAYYALSPLAYARAAREVVPHGPAVVVGLRTIGTTLSAVARAALGQAERLTVRPGGHPYDRKLELGPVERALIARHRGDHFLVADEGPGNSGSSFIAAAEALVEAGVPEGQITLLGTRAVDPTQLVAPDAARRFGRFRFRSVGQGAPDADSDDEVELSHGRWCARLRAGLPPVPVWAAAERRKRLSADGRVLRKFAGLGGLGRRVHERAVALAERSLTPPPLGPPDDEGFIPHRFVRGRALDLSDLSPALAAHLGRYIAARPPVELSSAHRAALQAGLAKMVEFNASLELGERLVRTPVIERWVIADGRLMPHEWLVDEQGRLLKTDATDHGDDHLFPGPTDPAWDLAGAIVEWQLGDAACSTMLADYRAQSGDDARARLPSFVTAYAAFMSRYCVMAASSSPEADAAQWYQAHARYTDALRQAQS